VHAHNLAGVDALLGFDDLEEKRRRFLTALHEYNEDIRPSTESLLQAAQRVEGELDTILSSRRDREARPLGLARS